VPGEMSEGPGLSDAVNQAGRRLSMATIMFHQAVADRLGLHPTDHKCIGLLAEAGSTTAGELAEATGLTSGAITGVIDRLEAAGFVRREDDPNDRRRVIIRVVPKRYGDVTRLFEPLAAAALKVAARYNEQERATILDFVDRSCQILREATLELRRQAPSARGKPKATRPRRRGERNRGARRPAT
jgi:DNA-binding MarR family transcriptional regulator